MQMTRNAAIHLDRSSEYRRVQDFVILRPSPIDSANIPPLYAAVHSAVPESDSPDKRRAYQYGKSLSLLEVYSGHPAKSRATGR